MLCFLFAAIISEEPECRVDKDCPPQMTCMQERCQNPCLVNNPCSRSQKCVVIDTHSSYRSVACVCPEGTVFSDRGYCQKGNNTFLSKNALFEQKILEVDCIH